MTITIEFMQSFMAVNHVHHEDVATVFALGHLIGIQHEDGTVNYINQALIGTMHCSARRDTVYQRGKPVEAHEDFGHDDCSICGR